jgi:PAS domain S-box-containing protein
MVRYVEQPSLVEAGLSQLDQLLAFVRHAPMSIAIFDCRMTYLATSERWVADYGQHHSTFVGLNHYEAHPDLPAKWKEAHRRGLAGETLDKKDDLWEQADGTRMWVSWTVSPWRDRTGAIGGIVITAENVTERMRAAEALRASEARFRLLADTSARLLAAEDPKSTIEELCATVMERLGCQIFLCVLVDAETANQRLLCCAGVPDEAARRVASLGHCEEVGGRVATGRDPIMGRDLLQSSAPHLAFMRSYGIQAYCCYPLRAEGRVIGALSFGTTTRPSFAVDDVELMRAIADQVAMGLQQLMVRQQLTMSNARLREADQRKDDFLAMLSHELRNPLAPIKSGVEILERAPAGSEAARRAQAIVGRQVSHLSRLIDDLLDVTRIARGKIDLKKERVELGDLALRCIEDHRSEFAKAGVELILEPCSDQLRISGDRTRLMQVIGNLLQNAAKFCPPGGQTFVSLEMDASGSKALLRIRDTGRGIASELLPHLFEPFVQARSSLDRSKGGLGLGLAVARGLVELHGGTVCADSGGVDQGSTFTIALPLDTTAATNAGTPQPCAAMHARRVLVVEDNLDAAETLRDLLELEGHRVEVAYDGRAALAKARSFRPDVVVCDIGLPEMNGFDVARALRHEPGPSQPTLVALTGYARPEDVARGREAGFDAHLAKPPSMEVLSHLLESAAVRAATI